MIVEELLTPENCTQFYYEAIRFKSDRVSKACEDLITQNFQDIERSEKGQEFLKALPESYLKNLLEADKLNVTEEKVIVEILEAFFDHRKDLPLLDEENPMKDWSNLTAEEKMAR